MAATSSRSACDDEPTRGRDDQADERASADRETGQLAAAQHVVGVRVVGQPGDQLEVRTPHEGAAVTVVEAVQREGGGRTFGDRDQPL